jgi:hypothetical protein
LEASLTKKLPFIHYPEHGVLAVLGRDGDLYATLLNEEYEGRHFALNKDMLIVPIILGGSTGFSLRE